MDSTDLSEVIKKHLLDIFDDTLKFRKSSALTTHESAHISREVHTKINIKACFDVWSLNELLCRCVVVEGKLFISKKTPGRKTARFSRAEATEIDQFTLADPKSITRAVNAVIAHLEFCLETLMKKIEPIKKALEKVQEYKETV